MGGRHRATEDTAGLLDCWGPPEDLSTVALVRPYLQPRRPAEAERLAGEVDRVLTRRRLDQRREEPPR